MSCGAAGLFTVRGSVCVGASRHEVLRNRSFTDQHKMRFVKHCSTAEVHVMHFYDFRNPAGVSRFLCHFLIFTACIPMCIMNDTYVGECICVFACSQHRGS